MPPEDSHALTLPEIEEALGRYTAAAREALDKGNDLLWAKRHRQIDDLLGQWLEAQAAVPA